MRNFAKLAGVTALTSLVSLAGAAGALAKPGKTLSVCKHGCAYSTIQSAVDHSGRNATINVRPGRYVEGVIVSGHGHDGLTIRGTGKRASAVLLEGRNATFHAGGSSGSAQNAIAGDNVNNLTFENLKAEHYASNGFFINNGRGYLMKNLIAGFNRSYGLYVFRCIGGRMTLSTGYGNGDSAFYVGGTPFETRPVTTTLDHLTGYENVLGYSGTNSKYMVILDSIFYNNGAGIVPNTLKSEPFQPATSGLIEHNLVFWNNFDYYKPGSPVSTVSSGVGAQSANYPIGAGVILFGVTGWTVRENRIFGNWLWGVAAFSDPTNPTGKALSTGNRILSNTMGRAGTDPNGVDLYSDGSGRGTCFAGNGTVTTDVQPGAAGNLYQSCPSTAGTGTTSGDPKQFARLAAIVLANPATKQEDFWTVHAHPPYMGIKPNHG